MQTDLNTKCVILADLWSNYRDDEVLAEFIEFHDLGLPMAYFQAENLATPTETGLRYILETFDNLLQAMEIEDKGFEGLNDLLTQAGWDN